MASSVAASLDKALHPFAICNDELPEALFPLCHRSLEEFEIALSEADEKVKTMKEQLKVLEKERQAILDARNACKGLLSPIRRVPNEIIAQLLRSCLVHPTLLDATDRQTFAAIRSVCRGWRIIAFALHDLWRGLSIAEHHQDLLGEIILIRKASD